MAESPRSPPRPWLEGAGVELDAARVRAILACAAPPRGRAVPRAQGAQLARGAPSGYDLLGHRAWREGDDPRALDAAASARAGRPLLRETRGEAARRVVLVLDLRAGMGVGFPGKLQRAAEIALLEAARTLRARGEFVCVVARATSLEQRPVRHWPGWHALARWLATLEAGASAAFLPPSVERACARAQRVLLVSDFLALDSGRASRLARRGRELDWVCVRADAEALRGAFAPAELLDTRLEWRAPEDGTTRHSYADAATLARVRARSAEHDQAWRKVASAVGARWLDVAAAEPLADTARRLRG
jgi:uncharacterized protein (DUF58 family)